MAVGPRLRHGLLDQLRAAFQSAIRTLPRFRLDAKTVRPLSGRAGTPSDPIRGRLDALRADGFGGIIGLSARDAFCFAELLVGALLVVGPFRGRARTQVHAFAGEPTSARIFL